MSVSQLRTRDQHLTFELEDVPVPEQWNVSLCQIQDPDLVFIEPMTASQGSTRCHSVRGSDKGQLLPSKVSTDGWISVWFSVRFFEIMIGQSLFFWRFTQNIEHDLISWPCRKLRRKDANWCCLALHATLGGHLVILVAPAKLYSQRRRFSTNSPMGPWQTAWTFFAGPSVRILHLSDGNEAFLVNEFDRCQ